MFDKDYFNGESIRHEKYIINERILHFYISNIRKYMEAKSDSLSLLDVGCAFGYFLTIANHNIMKKFGVDISHYALEIAKKNNVDDCFIVADIEKGIPVSNEYFNLITMLDLIEHLTNPINSLKEIYRLLRPGGIFLLSTPNFRSWKKYLKRKDWCGYKDKSHVNLFTVQKIKEMLLLSGFNVIEVKQFSQNKFQLIELVAQIFNLFELGDYILAISTKIHN